MADLKTNYKDDVLNTEVNERRKYQMIQNDDGTVSFVDVTDYSQVGDSFGAVDINATNEKVEEINSNLDSISKFVGGSETYNQCTNLDTAGYGMSSFRGDKTTNAPFSTASWGLCYTIAPFGVSQEKFKFQIAFLLESETRMYCRRTWNGGWSTWKTFTPLS